MKKKAQQQLEDFFSALKEAVGTIQDECNAQEVIIKKLEEEDKKTKEILQIHEAHIKNLDAKIQEVLKRV